MPPAQTSSPLRPRVENEVEALRPQIDRAPTVAIIADAGLAALAGELTDATQYPFGEHLSAGEAPRDDTLWVGTLSGCSVALVRSRSLHESFSVQEAALPVRVLATLGAEAFVLLGHAAGLAPRLRPATPFLLTDHLNLLGANPLVGANEDNWGPRFPDMTAPYDAGWRAAVCTHLPQSPQEGIYAALPGTATPAERAMLRRLGADAVGSSLVPDVLTARHMGRRVLAAVQLGAAKDGDAEAGAPRAAFLRAAVEQYEATAA